jgi:hypothetical protein
VNCQGRALSEGSRKRCDSALMVISDHETLSTIHKKMGLLSPSDNVVTSLSECVFPVQSNRFFRIFINPGNNILTHDIV